MMRYILNGFTQELGSRVFAFERLDSDFGRTAYTVRADLALIRRYGIRVQELPLLCRALLERRDDGETRTWTFTEEEMGLHAKDSEAARAEAARKRKPPRRPPSQNPGTAWRVPPLH